jgi:hypothetical protein
MVGKVYHITIEKKWKLHRNYMGKIVNFEGDTPRFALPLFKSI